METKYGRREDHAVDISSDHESAAPSQANSVADQHTSLMFACDSTGTAATATTVDQTSSSKTNKHDPSHNQQADDHRKHGQNDNEKPKGMLKKAPKACLSIAFMLLLLLAFIVVTLIIWSIVLVITSTVIPGIIIWLVLAYMITSLHQFAGCDDHVDIDDVYDTELGIYRYDLVVWMIQLTGILIVELLVYLALFRIGPFALRRLSLLDVHVWKWFLVGIIVLVYFGFWLLTHIILHEVREKSSIPSVFFRVQVLPILNGLLGVAVCGFYFLVELLIIKLVPPLRQPKILGLYAHKWIHALVYISIGLNVSRVISALIVAMLQKKHEHDGKFDYNPNKVEKAPREIKSGCRDPSEVLDFMGRGCKFIMSLLFRRFDPKKCTIYVVIGLRRSINFVLVSIWLLVTWISDFEHQLKPSHHATWILRLGTGTLICLLICAILWLVKNSIMLWWKYRSMYNRFYDEVVEEGIKLYLLGMICGQHLDVLNVGWSTRQEKKKHAHDLEKIKQGADQKNNKNNYSSTKVDEEKKKNAEESRERRIVAKARRILVPPQEKKNVDRQKGDHQSMNTTADDKTSHQPGIYAIKRMVKYFLRAEDTFENDINASIGKLRKKWLQAHYDQNAYSTPLTLDHIRDAYGTEISSPDFEILRKQMIKGDKKSMKQVYLQDFERWMERSQKTCYNRSNKLVSAQRLAQYLNRVMIAVIILATFCFWLILVTRSTKIVSLLGAPLVALSFIFGETCSTLFKGIIFSYVIHPYGIGDICIINGTLYEVKQIAFWTTTFLKVEANEVVSYPNSALFSYPIINKTNKKGGLDGYDSIEFILDGSNTNKPNVFELTKKIDPCFPEEIFQKPQLEVKCDIRDTEKSNVTIHFKHNLKYLPGMSNSECLQEMKKRKGELQPTIMKSCPELKIRKEESN